MEKILAVTISGKTYRLSESAYNLLTDYDRFLRKSIKDREKLLDIETQISAVIDTDLIDESQVIEESTIQEAISIVGNNENIKYYPGKIKRRKNYARARENNRRKKKNNFSRDSEKGIIGGVCAGIGNSLNIDPVIVRLIYVVVSFLFAAFPGILVYFVLWIALPDKNNIKRIKNNDDDLLR